MASKEGDFEGDEFEVGTGAAVKTKSLSRHAAPDIKIERSARNLKELEEREVKGDDVEVHFKLPDGSVETATFPLGQDVAFLKGHLQKEKGFTIQEQIFTLDGQVLIDPLSLRDYDSFVTARGPVTVEVSLRSS